MPTTTPGPIRLTVVTLYCRTREQRCEYYRRSPGGDDLCCQAQPSRVIYSVAGEHRVLTPKWCPLKGA